MVVKTELCFFSGYRIYPGHGRRYVRSDGRSYVFFNRKCERSFKMRRKPAKHNWTRLYRRLNKKGIQEVTQRRRNRRKASAIQKAVQGASLDVIRARRNQRPEIRKAAREAALKEVKERKAAARAKNKGSRSAASGSKMPVARKQSRGKVMMGGKK